MKDSKAVNLVHDIDALYEKKQEIDHFLSTFKYLGIYKRQTILLRWMHEDKLNNETTRAFKLFLEDYSKKLGKEIHQLERKLESATKGKL